MSGSLSYLKLEVLLDKVSRWLKPEGCFIVVDTYGYNPLFNLKRRLNLIVKHTTAQTVRGISKKETIMKIQSCFETTEIKFYGIFSFVGPLLSTYWVKN